MQAPLNSPEPSSSAPSSFWNLVAKNPKPIVPLAGAGEGVPLYLVHPISGDAGFYRDLARMAGRPVYGVQAPSQKVSAEFGSSIAALASYYVDALTKAQPEGRLIIGGWSAGAILALEMAQQLQNRGRDVPLLVILDGILYNTGAEMARWHPNYLWKLLLNLPRWIIDNRVKGWGMGLAWKRLRIEWRLALAFGTGGQNTEAESVLDAFLELSKLPPQRAAFSRALYHAAERYKPQPYDGPVLLYAAKTQPLFHLLQVDRCWRKIAPQTEVSYIWGAHQDMMEPGRARIIGAHLRDYLAM